METIFDEVQKNPAQFHVVQVDGKWYIDSDELIFTTGFETKKEAESVLSALKEKYLL